MPDFRPATATRTATSRSPTALPETFDVGEAANQVRAAGDSVWKVIYAERSFLTATLTHGQIHLLPAPIQEMIATPDFRGT
jgi:hypothetical protein